MRPWEWFQNSESLSTKKPGRYVVQLPSSTLSDVPMFQLQPTSIPVIVEVLQTCVIITALVTSLASLGVAIYAARISLKSATAASLPKALHERTSDNLDNISRKAIPALNNLAEQPKHRDGGPSEQHGTDAQHQAQSRAASRTADPPDARSLMEPIQLLVDQ